MKAPGFLTPPQMGEEPGAFGMHYLEVRVRGKDAG